MSQDCLDAPNDSYFSSLGNWKENIHFLCLENYRTFLNSSLYMALTRGGNQKLLSHTWLSWVAYMWGHAVFVTQLTWDNFQEYSKGHRGKLFRSDSGLFFKTSLVFTVSWQSYLRITVLLHTCSGVYLQDFPKPYPCGLLKFVFPDIIVHMLTHYIPLYASSVSL